jgi:transglutaminase-like putative cysteine protease
MQIQCGFDLAFDIPAPTPMLLALFLHPSRAGDVISREGKFASGEVLNIWPSVPVADYSDVFGNRIGRIVAPAGKLRISHRVLVRDHGRPDPTVEGLVQHAVQDLPPDVIQFLLASRYCEVDRFMPLAWQLFGKTTLGWERVKAILDFVNGHVEFGYAYARPTKTAWDVYEEKRGVCRDFQHLAITFCRCLNIPARYVTGYLGDIGVPPDPSPMDFSAWMEVYLSGAWRTLDARHNKPRIGRVLMAVGRDATDVALTTSFGPNTLEKFLVVTDEVKG